MIIAKEKENFSQVGLSGKPKNIVQNQAYEVAMHIYHNIKHIYKFYKYVNFLYIDNW